MRADEEQDYNPNKDPFNRPNNKTGRSGRPKGSARPPRVNQFASAAGNSLPRLTLYSLLQAVECQLRAASVTLMKIPAVRLHSVDSSDRPHWCTAEFMAPKQTKEDEDDDDDPLVAYLSRKDEPPPRGPEIMKRYQRHVTHLLALSLALQMCH